MISSEVQRTLVKSPPELWAEISDPDSLARHLGELGEIKITRIEPERLVEWEAAGTTGKVEITASGWGTKVTLSVERELPESAAEKTATAAPEQPQSAAEDTPAIAPVLEPAVIEDVHEPEPVEDEPSEARHDPVTASERFAPDFPPPLRGERLEAPPALETTAPAAAPIEAAEELAPAPEPEPEPEPARPGFFARLFGRGSRSSAQRVVMEQPEPAEERESEPAPPPLPGERWPTISTDFPALRATPLVSALTPVEPPSPPDPTPAAVEVTEIATVREPPAPESEPEPGPEPYLAPQAPQPDLAAELREVEETSEEMTAVLSAVLDRLGAAHHRPFSRS
jgi:hypothetical protein